jgi:ribosomal protein S18 acetylase RimI-like enzyme
MLDNNIASDYALVVNTPARNEADVTLVTFSTPTPQDGMRPVNLATDLAPLADLIELVFADSMDRGGMAAVREMRSLSHFGSGLQMLSRLNDLTRGISQGYVWVAGGRLVGNVSIYPALWPDDGQRTWIVANVGVHPDYQRRGIAHQLMQASLDQIRARGGTRAVLQVDADNPIARRLYTRLGFIEERGWTLWRRRSGLRVPSAPSDPNIFISRRRRGEWQAEYSLAQQVRPAHLGGIGWQRPLHTHFFHRPWYYVLLNVLNMRSVERLVIRSEDERELLAVLWLETSVMGTAHHLTLMVHPDYTGLYDDALINLAVRRARTGRVMIEHPSDETTTSEILRRYYFTPYREIVHMRWDVEA